MQRPSLPHRLAATLATLADAWPAEPRPAPSCEIPPTQTTFLGKRVRRGSRKVNVPLLLLPRRHSLRGSRETFLSCFLGHSHRERRRRPGQVFAGPEPSEPIAAAAGKRSANECARGRSFPDLLTPSGAQPWSSEKKPVSQRNFPLHKVRERKRNRSQACCISTAANQPHLPPNDHCTPGA